MGIEIERKFLVRDERWRERANVGVEITQGYLSDGGAEGNTVRVRLAGDRAMLAIKGPSRGLVRPEFEFPIPVADARELIEGLCGGRIVHKRRYLLDEGGVCWEIDEFLGVHHGLVLAEVELGSEDQPVEVPEWAGREVTHDPRYTNAALAREQDVPDEGE